MDTNRDINVASPSIQHEPGVEEMKVDNASDATEGNKEYLHPVEPLLSRQPLCCRVQTPRTLFPQMQGQLHEYSSASRQR